MNVPLLYHPYMVIRRKVRKFVRFIKNIIDIDALPSKVGHPLALSIEDAISSGAIKQKQGIETKKSVWEMFRPRCSYKTFVQSMNRWSWLVVLFLAFILRFNRSHQHPVKHIDSTAIAVCRNKNAKHHKTMAGIAAWGKTSQGSFFGLKLHVISDLLGRLQSLMFTAGNVSDKDKNVVLTLAKGIRGLLIGDAGYVSQKLADAFNRTDRLLMVKPYKNMRKIATALQNALYGTRMLVEKHFFILKRFYGLETSLPRSVGGYFANYFYALFAYVSA